MTNIGWQRNNLSRLEANTSNRLIGSVNVNYQASEELGLNVMYSNFRTTNKLRSTEIPIPGILDSIVLALVNQSLNFGFNLIKGEEKNQTFSGMLNYQQSNTIENDIVNDNQTNSNLMGNLAYSYQFLHSVTTVSGSFLANFNNSAFTDLTSLTPTISLSKGFYDKKLTLSSALSYVYILRDNEYFNSVVHPTFSLSYKLKKKHTLRLHSSYIIRNVNTDLSNASEFQEMISRLDYRYKF